MSPALPWRFQALGSGAIEFPWCGVLRLNLAEGGWNLGLACADSTKKPMPAYKSNVTLTLPLIPVYQQRALSLKRPKLRRIPKPSSAVNLG